MANLARSEDYVTVDLDEGDDELREASPLLKIWQTVWLNRWVVAGIILASVAIALVATLLATPQYTSTARVQVNRIDRKSVV